MNKSDKEIEIIAWMHKHGYDRKASKDIAPIIADYLRQHSANTPVSGSLPPVRCTTCGCTLVNNECERCDKIWNDLGNTLYEMGNEEPEW